MPWNLTGNSDVTTSSFLGTTNVQPLVIKTNDGEAMRVGPDGKVNIGSLGAPRSPDYRLDIQGVFNADEIYKGGVPLVESQWTTNGDRIIYEGGEVGIGTLISGYRLNVDGTLNATDIHKGGTPLVGSQWEDASGGISYSGGSVGIGTLNASYKLNVGGAINATEYRVNGSALVGSQWTNVAGVGIRYNSLVGLGKAPASPYKLDVAGSINATDILKNGSSVVSSQWTGVSGGITYAGGNVGIGTTDPQGSRVMIEHDSVPLLLRETGQSPTAGGLWRMPLDEGMWRFDVNTAAAGDFSSYATALTMYPTGDIRLGRNLNVAGQLRWGTSVANPDSIELGAPDSSTPGGGGTPFIDFHFKDRTEDFNTRIINDENGRLSVVGNLNVTGNVSSNGNVGIGTANPQTKLHISSGESQLRLDSVGNRAVVQVAKSGALQWDFGVGMGAAGNNDFWFGDFSAYRLVLQKGTGNVGVGTTTPQAKLDVSGSGGAYQCCAPVTPTLSLSEASNTASRQAWLQFHNWGEAEAYIRLAGGGPAGSGREGLRRIEIGDSQRANTALQVLANSNPIRFSAGWTTFPDAVTNQAEISNDTGGYKTLMIVGNRSAGVGRRVSIWDRLEVNGSAFKPGGGSWSYLSDARLKKSVESLKGALGKLMQLHGVRFEWKEPEQHGNLTGPQMGLIAQEVEEVFPEWIDSDPSGYKHMTVRGFEALVVEAFKELRAENETLRARIEVLEPA